MKREIRIRKLERDPKNGSRPIAWFTLSGTLMILLSACGSSSYTTGSASTTTPAPTVTTTATPTATPTNTLSTLAPISESFTLAGTRGGASSRSIATYSITTDNLLQVTVTAGTAGPNTVAGNSFVANYGCVNYKLTAAGETITTHLLSALGTYDSDCPGASQSEMIDFSSQLSPGHGPVTLTIESDLYDFDCISCAENPSLYDWDCGLYCPMDTVYMNHTVTGTLSILVNSAS